jgi:hypothetical protein
MMKKMFTLVFALGFLLGISSIVMAYGVFEETDLMTIPTATTLHQGVLGIAANFAEGNFVFLNCDLGLAPDLEVGIAVFNYPNDTYVSFRGKFQILREDSDTPALAVGVQDLGRSGNISPYITLSKGFTNVGVRGYIGVGGGNFGGIFGGLSKEFITSRKNGSHLRGMELFIEADSHNLNVGAKFALSTQTKINFGLIDMKTWMIGATFTVK